MINGHHAGFLSRRERASWRQQSLQQADVSNSTSCSLISRDFMLLPTTFSSSSSSKIFLGYDIENVYFYREKIRMLAEKNRRPGLNEVWVPAPAYLVVLDGQGFDIVTHDMEFLVKFINLPRKGRRIPLTNCSQKCGSFSISQLINNLWLMPLDKPCRSCFISFCWKTERYPKE